MIMMPTIRIDDEVWRFLQSKAKPFEDTPNDVLRRELGISSNQNPVDGQRHSRVEHPEAIPRVQNRSSVLKPDNDYTHHSVRGYQLEGRRLPARSFKDILVGLSEHLLEKHGSAFEKVALSFRGKKRSYFSRTPDDLRFPQQLSGSGLFVETNLNASLIIGICRALLEKLGHRLDSFRVE
jgi:negative regulator of replication initiation